MFRSVLIANRGEIACRIIQTARRLGLRTIAIYSEADAQSLHVKQADEAWCVGGPASIESYLNQSAIFDVAERTKAQAIHPGYGFLSEHPEFAETCRQKGFIFIGPSSEAMRMMGSKQASKALLESTNVPLIPGYHGENQSDETLLQAAIQMGFPILLKAAFGGGGKGMRTVLNEQAFIPALHAARRESLAYFDHDTIIIEKLMINPRHIEVQIMADQHGQVFHLFDRDCSIQRRHQKIIEEAPAPNLPDNIRCAMRSSAIDVARAIQYEGAGTIEFLYLPAENSYYFMEMNTRLQVEHPVTESITGIDLVEWQFLIAAGHPLPIQQERLQISGHAIECRLYAEDPRQDFIPSTGKLEHFYLPKGPGIRIDQGVKTGDLISPYYDSMIAKLITHGQTREEALQKMQTLLSETEIQGIQTNLYFLQSILHAPIFINAQFTTHFLNDHVWNNTSDEQTTKNALFATACYELMHAYPKSALFQSTHHWHPYTTRPSLMTYRQKEIIYTLQLTPLSIDQCCIVFEEAAYFLSFFEDQSFFYIQYDQQTLKYKINAQKRLSFSFKRIPTYTPTRDSKTPQHNKDLKAPMASIVLAHLKKEGDLVKKGEPLMILEAMKMEHTLHAPYDGMLQTFFYPVGAQVQAGQDLLFISEHSS